MNRGKHIFNLGHGVFPEVKPETLRKVSAFVHQYTQNSSFEDLVSPKPYLSNDN